MLVEHLHATLIDARLARFTAVDATFTDARFTAVDARFTAVDPLADTEGGDSCDGHGARS